MIQDKFLTEEHIMFRDAVREFFKREVAPHHEEWEDAGVVPRDVWLKAGENGFLCMDVPEEYGGLGLDYSYQVIFSEELGRITSGGVAMGIGVQTDMATPALANHGSDELKKEFLTPAISGDNWCIQDNRGTLC